MAQKNIDAPSMATSSKAERKKIEDKKKIRKALSTAKKIFSWLCGIACAVLPLFGCEALKWVYKSNPYKVSLYDKFISEFYSTGSFLWVAVALMTAALIDLSLKGMRKRLSAAMKFVVTCFAIFLIVCVCGCMLVFFMNITDPIDVQNMKALSYGATTIFAIASLLITFIFLREG